MHDSALVEEELRYWLVNEDWYMSRHTRDWLARTPREEAADLLARIAQDAAPEPRSLWLVVLTALAASGFSLTNAIAGKGPNARKAGTRAALMLADLNDPRCLPPLVRVFETNVHWQSKYQELIEAALLRFLAGSAGHPELSRYAPDVRRLAERIWDFGNRRKELPPPLTELLLAALCVLPRTDGEEQDALLRSLAESATTTPNRERVREAARALLGT